MARQLKPGGSSSRRVQLAARRDERAAVQMQNVVPTPSQLAAELHLKRVADVIVDDDSHRQVSKCGMLSGGQPISMLIAEHMLTGWRPKACHLDPVVVRLVAQPDQQVAGQLVETPRDAGR